MDMLELFYTNGVDEQRRQPEQKFRFGNSARDDLMGHMDNRTRRRVGLVAARHITVEEDALPGDEHVIKHDDGIQFLKARPQRVVGDGAPVVHGLPADIAQTWGGAGNGKGKGVGGIFLGTAQQRRGEDHEFISGGERC